MPLGYYNLPILGARAVLAVGALTWVYVQARRT